MLKKETISSKTINNYLGKIIINKEGEVDYDVIENKAVIELKNSIKDFGAIKVEIGGYDGKTMWHGIIFAPQYSDYFIPAIEIFLKRRGLVVKSSFVE